MIVIECGANCVMFLHGINVAWSSFFDVGVLSIHGGYLSVHSI